jgi:hypothetical protein
MPVLLVPLVIVFASAAVAALFWLTPLAGRLSITRLAWLLALAPLAAFVLLLSFIPAIPNEQALTWSFEWIPALGLHVGLYFDNLSALFALIVTGIGMLVVVYAGYYFKETRALTPTLSQGERGPELPLPMGEGRGEGIQKTSNHTPRKHTQTDRSLSPQQLIYYRDNWYIAAYCHYRKELRVFAIDNISSEKYWSNPLYPLIRNTWRNSLPRPTASSAA